MPSLDDQITDLIGDLFSSGIARERLRMFAKNVRAEALREAADRCDALHPAALAVHCATVIRALIDGAPSAPPADVTRALARLFARLQQSFNLQDEVGGIQIVKLLLEEGLLQTRDDGVAGVQVSAFGQAALSLAEEQDD